MTGAILQKKADRRIFPDWLWWHEGPRISCPSAALPSPIGLGYFHPTLTDRSPSGPANESRETNAQEPPFRHLLDSDFIHPFSPTALPLSFAALIGISPRTLQIREQGHRRPAGTARALLRVAESHP